MSLEIKNTLDKKESFVNIIVYGDSGVGKTSLIKTLPKGTAVVLSAEEGLLSVKDFGVDYIETKSLDDVVNALKMKDILKYKTIFIDSVTELSQNHLVYLKTKFDEKQALKLWGSFGEDFSLICKQLRDMKKNVVTLALCKEKEDANGLINKSPDIYGKTSERIMAWFDEVFYMHINKDGKHMLLTKKQKTIAAKDRSGKLEVLEEPNIEAIHKKILG